MSNHSVSESNPIIQNHDTSVTGVISESQHQYHFPASSLSATGVTFLTHLYDCLESYHYSHLPNSEICEWSESKQLLAVANMVARDAMVVRESTNQIGS